ncbi:hypothetical protein [Sulfurimonas sp.]|uniref:hypothetical protein n=1 Tax=Sulfurimonas sp. TaxID=2022749 RepID=UPI00356912BA
MKLVFLIIMLTTMLFSSEKQIIVGSFLQEKYALNSLVSLNNHILKDDKLSTLINKNSIEVELKTIGQYHVISLSPFTSYVQLLRTLKALEKYYDDAYVLEHGQKIEMPEVLAQKVVEERSLPVEVKIEKQKKVQIKKDEPVEVKIHKQVKEVKQVQEKDYTFEIVLALLVLLIIGYIIFKTLNRKKKSVKVDEEVV